MLITIAKRLRTTTQQSTNYFTSSTTNFSTSSLSVYCDGEGKLCSLGLDTNYRDVSLPTISPLPIPLHNHHVFNKVPKSTFSDNTQSIQYLLAGGGAGTETNETNENHNEAQTKQDPFNDTDTDTDTPDDDTLPPITPVAASGWAHSAVVTATGELWVWGRTHDMRNILRANRNSRLKNWMLGTKRSVDSIDPSPVEVPGVGLPLSRSSDFEALDVDQYALQLKPDTEMKDNTSHKELMVFDDRVVDVSCSAALTGCVTESGRAFLFGDNRVGQCGNAAPSEREWNPVRLRGISKTERVMKMGLGYQHGVVCTASGRVYCWGKGDRGQLGVGGKRTEHTATPIPVFDTDSVRIVMGIEEGLDAAGEKTIGSDGILRINGRIVDEDDNEEKNSNKKNTTSEEGRRRSAPNLMDENDNDENDNDENDNDNDNTTNYDTAPNTVTHNQSNSIPSSSSKTTKTSKGTETSSRPRAVDVDCGFAHTAALDSEGNMWIWGKFLSLTYSDDGTRHADQYSPRKIERNVHGINEPIVHFTCGQFHTTVLGISGRMWMIGMKSKTEMDANEEVIDRFQIEPIEILGVEELEVNVLKGGWSTTTIVTKDGKVYDASFRGLRGPREELEHLFVEDVAPGFRHRVVLGREIEQVENEE